MLEGFHPVLRHSVLAVRVFRRVGGKRDYLTGAKVVVACGNNWGDLALTDISLGGGGETFVCDSRGVAYLPLESRRIPGVSFKAARMEAFRCLGIMGSGCLLGG